MTTQLTTEESVQLCPTIGIETKKNEFSRAEKGQYDYNTATIYYENLYGGG